MRLAGQVYIISMCDHDAAELQCHGCERKCLYSDIDSVVPGKLKAVDIQVSLVFYNNAWASVVGSSFPGATTVVEH